jgi:hypothetical protein
LDEGRNLRENEIKTAGKIYPVQVILRDGNF